MSTKSLICLKQYFNQSHLLKVVLPRFYYVPKSLAVKTMGLLSPAP